MSVIQAVVGEVVLECANRWAFCVGGFALGVFALGVFALGVFALGVLRWAFCVGRSALGVLRGVRVYEKIVFGGGGALWVGNGAWNCGATAAEALIGDWDRFGPSLPILPGVDGGLDGGTNRCASTSSEPSHCPESCMLSVPCRRRTAATLRCGPPRPPAASEGRAPARAPRFP